MLPIERRDKIIDLLKKYDKIKIEKLKDFLGVSEITIRRDLKILEKEGKVIREKGVIILPKSSVYELSFKEREKEKLKEKQKIAKKALELIDNNMMLGMDASTTVLQIAKELKEIEINVSVITSSLPIFNTLVNSKNINLFFIGGKYDPKNLSFSGEISLRMIENFRLNIFFTGASSILSKGIYTTDFEGAELIRKMADISEKVIVVADKSKFKKFAPFLALKIEKVDIIITEKIEENLRKIFENKVEIIEV